jgi:Na+/phosphate symporter
MNEECRSQQKLIQTLITLTSQYTKTIQKQHKDIEDLEKNIQRIQAKILEYLQK